MLHWLYHMLFEPVSFWEQLKFSLIFIPVMLLLWIMAWLGFSALVHRKLRKEEKDNGLGN